MQLAHILVGFAVTYPDLASLMVGASVFTVSLMVGLRITARRIE